MTEEHHFRVRFGENEISDPRLSSRVTPTVNGPSTATLVVPSELLRTASPDYRSPVDIIVIDRGGDR
jgi:hypothetical protein